MFDKLNTQRKNTLIPRFHSSHFNFTSFHPFSLFNDSQLTILFQNKHVLVKAVVRHDGKVQVILTIASSDSNASSRIILQMTIVIAMFLVFQPGLLIGEMFLKNQLVFKSIGKSDGDFRDVIKGPILPYSNGGHGSKVDQKWVFYWGLLTLNFALNWRLSLLNGQSANDKDTEYRNGLYNQNYSYECLENENFRCFKIILTYAGNMMLGWRLC